MYTVTLEGGTGSEDIVFDYTITGTVSEADYTDEATVDGKLTLAARWNRSNTNYRHHYDPGRTRRYALTKSRKR